MSKKLILTLVTVGLLVFGVTAYAAERPAGSQSSPSVQKPLPGKVSNPDIVNPAAASAFQLKPVVVEIPQVTAVVGQPATLTIKVKSTDGAPVKQGDVRLWIDGVSLDNLGIIVAAIGVGLGIVTEGTAAPLVTDDNGIISFPIVPRPDTDKIIHMGANTIEAEFTGKTKAGNIKYKPAKGTGTLSILKGLTKIVPVDKNDLCLTYQVNVSSPSSCEGLAKRNVIAKSNGNQIADFTTETKGRLVIPSQLGQYSSCQLVFQGDEFYLPASLDRMPCWVKGY